MLDTFLPLVSEMHLWSDRRKNLCSAVRLLCPRKLVSSNERRYRLCNVDGVFGRNWGPFSSNTDEASKSKQFELWSRSSPGLTILS